MRELRAALASHNGLRLYFGRHAPDEVLKHIFAYGFHLWLGQPWEVTTRFMLFGRLYRGYSTRRYVDSQQLTLEAQQTIDHEAYADRAFDDPHVAIRAMDLACPERTGIVVWHRVHPQSDQLWMVPVLSDDPLYRRTLWSMPPPDWTDADLDDM